MKLKGASAPFFYLFDIMDKYSFKGLNMKVVHCVLTILALFSCATFVVMLFSKAIALPLLSNQDMVATVSALLAVLFSVMLKFVNNFMDKRVKG